MQENSLNMDINTGSTNWQAIGLSANHANSVSQIEILVLRNELFALRDRVTSLERQLSTIKQCTDCQMDRNLCVFCQELHSIQHCDYFKYLQVSDRWSVAKKLNLCYRCLEKSHYGLNCPQSKMCGINHCRLTHSTLLHDEKRRNRKRAKHQESTSPFEPPGGHSIQDQSEVNLTDFNSSGSSESSNMTPESTYGEFSPHAGMTVACDETDDRGNIDELNRLAMLAETDVKIPFDLIFGGSCGKELGSSQSRNMTSNFNLANKCSYFEGQPSVIEVPSGQENDMYNLDSFDETRSPHAGTAVMCDSNIDKENLHEPQMDDNNNGGSLNNLDSSYNEYVDPAVKHPCPIEVVVNFNHENASANDETDSSGANSLDPLSPEGYDPFRFSGGKKHEYQNGENGFKSIVGQTDDLKEQHETSEPSGGEFQTQSIDIQTESLENKPVSQPVNKSAENTGLEPACNDGGLFENNDDPGPEPTFAVKLEQLLQKCGAKETLLDVLSNQMFKLDEEIKICENALSTSPAPPAENLCEKQSPSDKPEVDLSVWLMPSAK